MSIAFYVLGVLLCYVLLSAIVGLVLGSLVFFVVSSLVDLIEIIRIWRINKW